MKRSSSLDYNRVLTNHPSEYYHQDDAHAIIKSSSMSKVENRSFEQEAAANSGHVRQMGKLLEKSIIIPQYTHRVGSKPVSCSTRHSVKSEVPEEEDSIVSLDNGALQTKLTQRVGTLTKIGESNDIEEEGKAFLLSPHRFGSIDLGNFPMRWNEDEEVDESSQSDEIESSIASSDEINEEEVDDEPDGWSILKSNKKKSLLADHNAESVNEETDAKQSRRKDSTDLNWNEKKHPPPQLPPPPENLTKEKQKRRYIMENILKTETSYVEVLESLVQDYEMDLFTRPAPVISNTDRRMIFFKLRSLLQIHRSFRITLTDCAKCWDVEEKIGESFSACFNRETVRDVYASYINNYSNAMEKVKELSQSNSRFETFLNEKQRLGKTRLPLIGLMVKPIQRFPQFIMLLQDLLKNTPDDHHDHRPLQQALTEIELLATYLNNRKKEYEQEIEAKKFINEIIKSKQSFPETKHSKMLSRVSVQFNRYTKKGKLKLQIEQELILFDTMILCCTKQTNGQYKLEWFAPLDVIRVHEHNITPDIKTSIGEDVFQQTVITSFNANIAFSAADSEGKARLQELQSLIHDHTVLTRISSLATSLKYSYRGFDEIVLQSICNHLQHSIQQKIDENRLMDSSLLSLKVFSRKSNTSSPTTYIFQLQSPEKRNTWIEQFIQTKLSHDKINQNRWYLEDWTVIANNPISQCINKPLFLSNSAIDVSRNLGEVNCAVPVCLVYGNILKRFLWCCHANAGITIVSIYNQTPTILQNFRCDTLGDDLSFWCVEMVPGLMSAANPSYQADMVWVGTNIGVILIYSLLEDDRTSHFLQIETESPIISICYADNRVYAGLLNGSIYIFCRIENGEWTRTDPLVIGDDAVIKISKVPNSGMIVAACDNKMVTMEWQNDNLEIDYIVLEPPEDVVSEEFSNIQDFVVNSLGAWVTFQRSLAVQLVIFKSHQVIQTVHIERTLNALKKLKSYEYDEKDFITCLSIVKDWLMIGTAAGFICKLYIPRFESTTFKTSSPCVVSLHKHKGAVRFIASFQNFVERFVESIDFGIRQDDSSIEQPSNEVTMRGQDTIGSDNGRGTMKSVLDETSLRRVSMTPLKNKWLSNPNLLLSMQMESESKNEKNTNLNNLMVAFESMECLDDSYDDSVQDNSQKESEDAGFETASNTKSEADKSDSDVEDSAIGFLRRETEKQVVLSSIIIVTGGLGYEDLGSDGLKDEDVREPCIISWRE